MNELRRRMEAIVDRISASLGFWGGYITLNDGEFRAWHRDEARLDRAMERVPDAVRRPLRVDHQRASGVWHIPVNSGNELIRALRQFDPRRHKFVIDETSAQALGIRPQLRITSKLNRRVRRIFGNWDH